MTLQQAKTLIDEEERYEPDIIEDSEEDHEPPIDQFDIVSSPNDFNVITIVNFIQSGVVKIPGFQRNFVWDIKRASKLVESILIGLPIPQTFLYEQERNKFLVIDGQQRLMSIYYFVNERFPRKEKLVELRQTFDEQGRIPESILSDDAYFTKFNLNLSEQLPGHRNRFNKLSYSTLGDDYQTAFNLRTIRNIIVKQVSPDDNSSMYEIFNRLNSGGMNLTPQEIRRCMYDSAFYDALYKTNTQPQWRRLVGAKVPDLHMKDVEILLRGFAILINEDSYSPSMVRFLNAFSESAKAFGADKLKYLEGLLQSFIDSCSNLPNDTFQVGGRFSPIVFESVFVAACSGAYSSKTVVDGKINPNSVQKLRADTTFIGATQNRTTATDQVRKRLSRACEILSFD